jgi:hypothetical protein
MAGAEASAIPARGQWLPGLFALGAAHGAQLHNTGKSEKQPRQDCQSGTRGYPTVRLAVLEFVFRSLISMNSASEMIAPRIAAISTQT